jgi:hypothetical protein
MSRSVPAFWGTHLGHEVVAMTKAPYDTKLGHFPYCKKHNRIHVSAIAMWLTPVYPEQLQTFQALCDICKAEDIPSTPLFIHQRRIPA